jgi:hypothetical protein
MGTCCSNQLTQLAYFFQRVGNELLSAKSRIDTHQQYHIHFFNDICQHGNRCCRIQGNPCLHSSFLDLLHHPVQMRTSLKMHIHHHGTQVFHFPDKLLRLYNHQMYIQRFLRQFSYIFQDRKAKRNVRYKDSVHDVNMQPVCLAGIDFIQICFQVAKVCRQQGGGNQYLILHFTLDLNMIEQR